MGPAFSIPLTLGADWSSLLLALLAVIFVIGQAIAGLSQHKQTRLPQEKEPKPPGDEPADEMRPEAAAEAQPVPPTMKPLLEAVARQRKHQLMQLLRTAETHSLDTILTEPSDTSASDALADMLATKKRELAVRRMASQPQKAQPVLEPVAPAAAERVPAAQPAAQPASWLLAERAPSFTIVGAGRTHLPPLPRTLDARGLRAAIIWREILDPPFGLRPRPEHRLDALES